ncbi:prenyltransferase/squalene oxidase repeat-containing protein [Limnoglobus roseus]|uniref:Beta-subunit of geranylgeranyltransferase or farnesyltransferase n=1 Tax=Limnoglobus roseus TaxID=2598579 RepID=A0A5C1AFG8_9BACT|nr:prenyltransferase/squalene oxidase repeat-containing protein [Limnoglobus roseus]QEL16963.1 beta-subunit of geranylgeranyltransferase or farnesyltransferase [Limnoglobus roseus]
MDAEPYLTRLTVQLIDGVEKLPDDVRTRHAEYLLAQQRPDGGWPGREGGSDLYYTGFALRSLAVLQSLNETVCGDAARFLRSRLSQPAGVVDFFSLLVSCYLVPLGGGPNVLAESPPDWRDRVCDMLESFRTPDGGYAKVPNGTGGSTYTSFLVALSLQLLERPIPNLNSLAKFVLGRQRDDGGFVEIAPMKRSGTNPTAAGVGVLQIANALTDDVRARVIDFLAELPAPGEGGFRANDRIPAADLLSTFTGAWTLDQLGGRDRLNLPAIRDYAEECESPRGGFHGGLWDEGIDVEYTFYGLGTLALTADVPPTPGAFSK